MPKKTEHQRRVELGKWLEMLLNPEVSKWDIYQLFQQAIILLDIEFQINKDHSFFQLIENIHLNENERLHHGISRCHNDLKGLIDNLSEWSWAVNSEYESGDPDWDKIEKYELKAIESQKKVKWEDLPQVEFKDCIPTSVDEDLIGTLKNNIFHNNKIREELIKKFRVKYNLPKSGGTLLGLTFKPSSKKLQEKYQKEVLNHPKIVNLDTRVIPYASIRPSIESILKFFNQIDTVSTLLKKIKEQDKPWKISIPAISKQEKLSKNSSVEYFIEAYSAISDILHIKEGILVFERTLSHRFAPIAITNATEETHLHMVTEAFLSNILFDFLLLGGQEYYGFCEYCGKFFAIERKGRKKFCSDICRTMKQRQ